MSFLGINHNLKVYRLVTVRVSTKSEEQLQIHGLDELRSHRRQKYFRQKQALIQINRFYKQKMIIMIILQHYIISEYFFYFVQQFCINNNLQMQKRLNFYEQHRIPIIENQMILLQPDREVTIHRLERLSNFSALITNEISLKKSRHIKQQSIKSLQEQYQNGLQNYRTKFEEQKERIIEREKYFDKEIEEKSSVILLTFTEIERLRKIISSYELKISQRNKKNEQIKMHYEGELEKVKYKLQQDYNAEKRQNKSQMLQLLDSIKQKYVQKTAQAIFREEEYKVQNQSLLEELKILKQDMKRLQIDKHRLKQQLQIAYLKSKNESTVIRQVDPLNISINRKEKQLLQENVEKLKKTIIQIQKEKENRGAQLVSKYQNQLNTMKMKIEQLEKQKESLRQTHNKEVEKKSKKQLDLETKIIQKQTETQKSQFLIKEYKNKLAELETELKITKNQNKKLSEQLRTQSVSFAITAKQKELLEGNLQELKNIITQNEREKKNTKEETIINYQNKLIELKNKIVLLEKEKQILVLNNKKQEQKGVELSSKIIIKESQTEKSSLLISELRNRILNLQNELKNARERSQAILQKGKEELLKKQKQNSVLQNQNTKISLEVKKLKEEISKLEVENSNIKKKQQLEIENFEKNKKEWKGQLERQRSERKKIAQEADNKYKILEGEKKNLELEIHSQKDKINKLTVQNGLIIQKIKKNQNEIKQLQFKYKQEKEKLQKGYQKTIGQKQEQSKQLRKKKSEQMRQLTSKFEMERKKWAEQKQEIIGNIQLESKESIQKFTLLKVNFEKKEEELINLRRDYQQKIQIINTLKDELTKAKQIIDKQAQEIANLKEQIQQLNQKIFDNQTGWEEQSNTLSTKINQLENNISSLQTLNNGLSKDLNETRSQNKRIQQEFDCYKSDNETLLQNQIENNKKKNAQYDNQILLLNENCCQFTEIISFMEISLDEQKKLNQKLQSQISMRQNSYNTSVQQLQKKIDSLDEMYKEQIRNVSEQLQLKISKDSEEINKLNKQIESNRKQIEELNGQSTKYQNLYEGKCIELQNKVSQMDIMAAMFEEQLKTKKK